MHIPHMTSIRGSRARWAAVPTAILVAAQVALTVAPSSGVAAVPADQGGACPWMNTHKTADQRARILLANSSLGQKLRWLNEQSADSPNITAFGSVTYPIQVPCTPTVIGSDGPDYVRSAAGATVFPAQISLASAWSTDLAYAKGKAEGDESYRSGHSLLLAPGLSSSRTPLAGRTPEYLGEDSLLSGDLAAADINGIQTGNADEPVLAVVKHYIANEQELDRQQSNSVIDGRTLREVYNMPFAIAIAKGSPDGVMCSYNQVNGVYACENPILNNLLKTDDKFNGFVMSDFGAVHSTAPSLNAGLDYELNRPVFYTPDNISAAIDAGSVTMAQIDAAALRVVRSYIKAGVFDHPAPATPAAVVSTPENKAVAQSIAEQGSVLLKNQGDVLPLSAATKSIAVIGQTASNAPTGGVSAATVCAEGGPTPFGPARNACTNPVAPLDAITARAAQVGASVTYNNGADITSAAATAAAAGVAVVFGYAKQGEFTDRTTLGLDGNGDALIAAVTAANPNTVVILETGTATTMPWLASAKAVVEAWYPGDQQGTALARLLYGDVNFVGRLPMTFPKSLADTPEQTPAQYPGVFSDGTTSRPVGSTEIRQVSFSEGLAVGYKWYDSQNITLLFPFGYGLSYTSFVYNNLSVTPTTDGRHRIKVSFLVTNSGHVTGTATNQVYLTLPSTTGEPGKRLVAFPQVTLAAGRAHRVSVTIDPQAVNLPLSYYDTVAHRWNVAAGL